MKIIGITGTLGAGKGTIVDYLVTKRDFAHYSARDFINEEVIRRGRPLNRDSQTLTANELRAEHGPGYIIQELYKRALGFKKNSIIESIRTPGEVTSLKEAGDFIFLAIDADPALRYERITKRGSEKDSVSFEKFLTDESREMTSSDPTKQNISAVMAQADYKLINNGTREELEVAIEKILAEII